MDSRIFVLLFDMSHLKVLFTAFCDLLYSRQKQVPLHQPLISEYDY